MKKIFFVFMISFLLSAPAIAVGGLDTFLSNLNIRAQADLGRFCATVSANFGVPEARVRVVLDTVREPAAAFMVFQLSRQPTEKIIEVYQARKDKGWGVIAKELGIKPGSAEFHALKRGDFSFDVEPSEDPGIGKGKGKGKGKDKGKHK